MLELNKFGVTRLLHLHKGILPCHKAEFLFQKPMYVKKYMFFFVYEKKTENTEMAIKNLYYCFSTKTHYSSFIIGVLGMRCEETGAGE